MPPSEPARDAAVGDAEVALITAPDADVGLALARALVEERLAACVNLVPAVRSVYRWQDRIQDDAEVLLVVKTCAARAEQLAARVRELHPYELPELIRLPLAGGSAAYLRWLLAECAP